MKLLLKSRFIELIITLITCFIVFQFYTPVMDDIGSFFESLASSQYSNFSFIDYHFLALIGIHPLYKSLYKLLPAYNWMGISFMLLQCLGLYLVLRILKNVVFAGISNLLFVRFLQLFFAIAYLDNFCSVSHTRFSLLFCGLGLFVLAFKREVNKKDVFFYSALFLLGMLYRPESSLGMLLLVSAGYLIFHFDFKSLISRLLIPFSLVIILFSFISINWIYTDVFMEKIEPEIEYKMMDKRIVPLSTMKNEIDSVKYQVAIKGIWLDPAVITPKFLRSIQTEGINTSLKHINNVFLHVCSLYSIYIFVLVSIIALFLLSLFNTRSWLLIFKIVALNFSVFILIYASDFNGLLITDRHFLNIQLISLLISLFYFFSNSIISSQVNSIRVINIKNRSQFFTAVIGGIVFLSLILLALKYKEKNDINTQKVECAMASIEAMEDTYSNRTIVVTMKGVFLFDHLFSFKNRVYRKNKYILYDAFTYSLIPEYIEYLSTECQCNSLNPISFFSWLSKQDGLYLTDDKRAELTKKYMHIVHQFPLDFISPDSVPNLNCNENLNYNDVEIYTVHIKDV